MDDATKYPKEVVGFEHPAQGPDMCLMCRHYQGGACQIIEGRVMPGDWCNQFSKRAQPRGQNTRRYHVERSLPVGIILLAQLLCGCGSGSVVSHTEAHWGQCETKR